MADVIPIRRALVSVSDKDGLIPLARTLHALGCELVSTGGTARALTDAGLPVTLVDAITRFPEMLDGRVKTLHPAVHGGLLARRDDPEHMEALREHTITPIDLLVVNLYPFERTVAATGVTMEDAIENIDVGGPAMIRAAAKNHDAVAVATDPAQYAQLIAELESHRGLSMHTRRRLAAAAFARTAAYDAAIAGFLAPRLDPEHDAFPDRLILALDRAAPLRYGENPHQHAAVYRAAAGPLAASPSLVDARQLHGKELSYNNLLDAAAARSRWRSRGGVRRHPRCIGPHRSRRSRTAHCTGAVP
jgi:phosphoribosylaminoimidazolecarboxamide formyltransferase/IMP cyclohydrolase